MGELPEGRQPLTWKDMEFADRPRGHPSTERLEIDRLREAMWRAVNLIESGRYDQAKTALAMTLEQKG
jgi:hypothetical protein